MLSENYHFIKYDNCSSNYSWFIKNPTSGTSMSLETHASIHASSDWLRRHLIKVDHNSWLTNYDTNRSVYRQYWIKHFNQIQLARLKGRWFYSFRWFCFCIISAVLDMGSYLPINLHWHLSTQSLLSNSLTIKLLCCYMADESRSWGGLFQHWKSVWF